jgi:penicillin amidase
VIALAAAGVIWLSTSLPTTDARVRIAGLAGPVEIFRDNHGIPHIFAMSDGDGFFALGYVHAQDRLWQMEFQRRIGAGRLAEIVGPAALRTDETLRRLGTYRAAQLALDSLNEPVRIALERYAEGVNAWIESHRGALPLEFTVLNHEPEPWQPADSLVWGKLMALQLGLNFRTEALRARLLRRLPRERVAELWPDYPAEGPMIVPSSRHTSNDAADPPSPATASALEGLEKLAWPWADEVPRSASNAWVVSGARSATGKPLLANDPHLSFAAPILWYLARVETPAMAMAGATVPGVPFFVLGHNGKVAWGLTIAQTDQQDLFIERRNADDPAAYDTPDGPREFERREEVIRVKGASDTRLTIEVSRHGPVLYDGVHWPTEGTGESYAVALSMPSQNTTDRTAQGLYEMARAANADELSAALRHFVEPQLNVVFADTGGRIAYVAAGVTPIRASGDGEFARPGWHAAADWVGTVPFAELPRLVDPPSGQIVAANNRIVDATYPHYLGRSWAPPYRARRLLDLLGEHSGFTAQHFQEFQRDNLSMAARDLLPLMTAFIARDEETRAAIAMLNAWDGMMRRDRPEPLVFSAWLRELNRALYRDELGEEFDEFFRLRALFVKSALSAHTHWCDDATTPEHAETCVQILEKSLQTALADLTRRFGADVTAWRWGDAHVSRFTNRILDRVPGLRAFANLSIPNDGGDDTVHRGTVSVRDDGRPFEHIHGAGFRAVYDFSDLSKSRFVIATGQSGNLLSRHYGDLLKIWRDGGMVTFSGSRSELMRDGAALLTLMPK